MSRIIPVQVIHGMLIVSAALAFAAVPAQAADVEELRRTMTSVGQELDNVLSTTKSINDLLVTVKAGLLLRHGDPTIAATPFARLYVTLAYVEGLQTRLDGLSNDTTRAADVLESISLDVVKTGDAALIEAYSNVKRQVGVVYDAIRMARILGYDITNVIRRMMVSHGTDSTNMHTRTSN